MQRMKSSSCQSTKNNESGPWFLSRLLSRECSLSSGWTGPGVSPNDGRDSSIFAEVSTTDFSTLANGHSWPEGRGSGGVIYNTSICGQFLLVGCETIIYIYDLRNGNLIPATSVACPRRILAMSMDVSSGRNAVAVLLEGRMGIVCELQFGQATGGDLSVEISVESQDQPCRSINRGASLLSIQTGSTGGATNRCSIFAESSMFGKPYIESVDVQSNHQSLSLQGVNDRRTHAQNFINSTWNLDLQGPRQGGVAKDEQDHNHTECVLPVENGTSTFYRHLCSDDDPPRSGMFIQGAHEYRPQVSP